MVTYYIVISLNGFLWLKKIAAKQDREIREFKMIINPIICMMFLKRKSFFVGLKIEIYYYICIISHANIYILVTGQRIRT